MAKKIVLSNEQIQERCADIANDLPAHKNFYGVPRGGIAPAYLLAGMSDGFVVSNPEEADFFVDDLIDSGRTRAEYRERFPFTPFIFLYEKIDSSQWFVFPWEVDNSGNDTSGEDIFIRLLEFIGEDPSREGLLATPKRMMRAWTHWTQGYGKSPKDVFTSFEDGAEDYDQMLLVDPIPFFSHCEHHLAIFFGEIHIAYIPHKKIAGLSKFIRLARIFSQRLQVQERLTVQIANAIFNSGLETPGVGVFIKARHMCMESRGVSTFGTYTKTSALRGVFMKPEVREEFFNMIKL
jgi:GTP cyclohydrolase I